MSNTATFNTSQNLKLSKKLSFGEEVANSVTHAVGAIVRFCHQPLPHVLELSYLSCYGLQLTSQDGFENY